MKGGPSRCGHSVLPVSAALMGKMLSIVKPVYLKCEALQNEEGRVIVRKTVDVKCCLSQRMKNSIAGRDGIGDG